MALFSATRIALALGGLEPDPTESRVDDRRIGMPLGRASERQHCRILASEARVRQAHAHESFGSRRLERRQRFELFDRLTLPARIRVERHELFAGGRESRFELHGSEQCALGLLTRTTIAKAEAEQVVRLRQSIVEAHGPPQCVDRFGDITVAIVGKAQLVDHARRAVVQTQTALVVGGRRRMLAHGGVRVAEQFERSRGVGSSAAASVRSRTAEANSPRCR